MINLLFPCSISFTDKFFESRRIDMHLLYYSILLEDKDGKIILDGSLRKVFAIGQVLTAA